MTGRKYISDSTPLIALARIGELDLARRVFGTVLVPRAVYEEVVEARGDAPGASEVAEASWVETVEADPHVVAPLLVLLDRGEAEAIAVALAQPIALLLTDDRKARRVARQVQVEVKGTLGVLRLAKRRRLIAAIRPFAARLQSEGLRISGKEMEEFLRLCGE